MMRVIGIVLLYIVAFVLIVVGVFCGIQLYKEIQSESYINGSIDISNRFSQESFNYSSTSVVFYHDLYDSTSTYTFEKDFLKVDDFDGTKNTYEIVLNDYVLLNADVNAGSVSATVNIDFYDTAGEVISTVHMKISVKFLSNKTQLTLTTVGSESASFLEQYFADNGIRLQIIEILEGGNQ